MYYLPLPTKEIPAVSLQSMKRMYSLGFFCFALCCLHTVSAQSVLLNPDTAFTAPGGIANMQIELRPPAESEPQSVDLSVWKSLLGAEDSIWQVGWERQGTRWVFPIRFMFLDTGIVELPPLTIKSLYNDEPVTLSTPTGATIVINDFPLTNQELAPIKDIIAEPKYWRDYLTKPLIAGLIGLALLICSIWYFRRKKTPKEPVQQTSQLPPRALARKRIAALKAKKLPEQEAWKAYYSELTFILRDYLESGKGIKALESTSDEILRQIKGRIPNADETALRQLFLRSDLVKFAKGLPPVEYHSEAMEVVEEFLKH